MNRICWTAQFMLLISLGLAVSARAQAPDARLYVITHVDITPNNVVEGKKLLRQYIADTHQDSGLARTELLDYKSRPNHFAIIEVWKDSKSFDRHEAADHTKKFREKLAPFLGSPYDERLFNLVN